MWVLLPSTSVVVQFLSTRHYLEGMMFSALALCLLQRGVRAGALVSMVVGMLCKETYAVLIPAIVLLYAWRRRDRGLALSTAAIVCVYAVYRYWMLGPALSYDMPLLTIGQYLKFLTKLPYSLSSNYGGYCLCGIIAALSYYFARRSRENRRTILYFLGALALSLGPIFPASWPLYGTIRNPDPWYRILFLLNTVVIVFGGYLAVRSVSRRMQLALAILAIRHLDPRRGEDSPAVGRYDDESGAGGKILREQPGQDTPKRASRVVVYSRRIRDVPGENAPLRAPQGFAGPSAGNNDMALPKRRLRPRSMGTVNAAFDQLRGTSPQWIPLVLASSPCSVCGCEPDSQPGVDLRRSESPGHFTTCQALAHSGNFTALDGTKRQRR